MEENAHLKFSQITPREIHCPPLKGMKAPSLVLWFYLQFNKSTNQIFQLLLFINWQDSNYYPNIFVPNADMRLILDKDS